jgi:hypothetical protein
MTCSFARLAIRSIGRTTCFASLVLVGGCIDSLDRNGALVNAFSTHHASPEDGVFPERGIDEMPRRFQTNAGWDITLVESYVTISNVTLVACDGTERPLRMYWGPCPEDLHEQDLATLTVAGLKVPAGNYCELRVEYGPYESPPVDEEGESQAQHATPKSDNVDGATIYIRGGATDDPDADMRAFELRYTGTVEAVLDLSELEGEGSPLRVGHREDFPKELTISKTYDRFFDDVDFDAYDPAELEDVLGEILVDETRVVLGQQIDPDMFD